MRARLATVAVSLALAACSMTRGRADQAFARKDYLVAAELYDRALADAPDDTELRARRGEARRRALAGMVEAFRRQRDHASVEQALDRMGELLARRDRWLADADPAIGAAIAGEVGWVHDRVAAEVHALIEARRPLAAEALLASRAARGTAADLAARWPALREDVRAAGARVCAEVTPADPVAAPYLADLAAGYCRHFGTSAPSVALPDTLARIELAGAVHGQGDAQHAALVATIDHTLAGSPWGGGEAVITGVLDGAEAVRAGVRRVRLAAPWTATVPYSATESYQQPYTRTETYTVSVPYTESYSCGSYSSSYGSTSRTCTRSASRSETRTRTVTDHRTAWRTVTRYRQEPRTFTYAARERIADYDGAWRLTLPLADGGGPVVAELRLTDHRSGYDHDARFPPAGVAPARANLPDADAWTERLRAAFATELARTLASAWQTRFCTRPLYDAESAARCARGGAPPHAARAALHARFGEDLPIGDTLRGRNPP